MNKFLVIHTESIITCLVMLLIQLTDVSARDVGEESHESHALPGHRITLIMANSLVDNSFTEESGNILVVPTFGFYYDYFMNERWGVGLHTDILVQQFKVEKHGDKRQIVRGNPVGIAGMVLFRPHRRWVLMAGYGFELEKNENFQMFGIGFSKILGFKNNH